MDAFVQATDLDQALNDLIQRLQASPQFGKHMAWSWLDAGRYGDSDGYESDPLRNMWPSRDWVINAFNANNPFDLRAGPFNTEFTAPIDRKFRGKFSNLRLSDPLRNPGARSPYRGEISFGVTPKYFYIFAQSESPKAHPSALEKDDPTIVNDDAVRFIIETDRETEYLVTVNSSGTLLDARVSGEDGLDSSWDSGAEVAVPPTETGWDAVIRIPLDRLGGTGPSEENYWRFNAARHLPEVDPISAATVLVTNGTNDIDSLQNSARLIPGARTEIFEEDNVEDGQF
ncbi:MAG: hypothetical protein ACJASX_002204 [Limisphaerales bacterium]